ncbi:MAG: hypothetical protein LBM08_05850 [Dysgonamonadaceae bacterium]|jgi:hypothetical protein|nr:hypothetical protein [Dysgonamonadaceae bacterium]
MIFKFLLLSDETDHFRREITIDSTATFLDLNDAILDAVGYTKDQMTSFFICEDDWSKLTEITLIEMDTSSEEDNYVMKDTVLGDLLEDEKQKLLFIFDCLTERAFFMELREIIPNKKLSKALCSTSIGNPPEQLTSFEDSLDLSSSATAFDEDLYGDELYDMDELDPDGFDGLDALENIGGSNPYDD